MSTRTKANLGLLLVAMFWGSTSIVTKIGLESTSEFTMIALRFSIAFLTTFLFFIKRIKWSKKLLIHSSLLGFILFTVFILMVYGVKNTTASNAGFLTCLAGLFVPILNGIYHKTKIPTKVLIAVVMASFGIGLLTLTESLTFNNGDLLCTLCSLMFAVHIIVTNKMTQTSDPLSLGIMQLGFASIYSVTTTLLIETPVLPKTLNSWFVILFLSLVCSAFAFILQTLAQKHTSAVTTGMIYTLEPVFAAMFAYLLLNEILTFKNYLGAIILVFSIFLIEVDEAVIKKKIFNW